MSEVETEDLRPKQHIKATCPICGVVFLEMNWNGPGVDKEHCEHYLHLWGNGKIDFGFAVKGEQFNDPEDA
jgi:hypothetical protein